MEALSNSLFHHDNLAGLFAKNTQDGLNLQSGILSRTRAKAELEITTAEGDRVTLYSKSKVQTAYASYDSQGKLMGAESSGTTEMYSMISTNKVSMSVEGELNEEELADIQRLLQSVEDLFMNYLTGNGIIEDSMMSSLSLDSMKTLSNFDAELKYSQKIEGFGVVSGSNNQISDPDAAQKPAATETGLVSETSGDAAPDLTTMTAFKSKMKTSVHLSGTRLIMGEPAQATPPEILPGTGDTANPPSNTETTLSNPAAHSVSTGTGTPLPADNITAAPDQVTDTSASDTGTLSPASTLRMNLAEEFASFIQSSTIGLNRLAPMFSQFTRKSL